MFKKFKEQSKGKKVSMLLVFLLLIIMAICLSVYNVGRFLSVVDGRGYDPLFYALKTKVGFYISLFVAGIIVFISLLALGDTNKTNRSGKADERGVHYMDKGTFGTSRWLEEENIVKNFEVDNITNTKTTIYGQLGKNGDKVVGWKANQSGPEGNRNTFVLASMGSGKSFGYVRTELLQAVERGNSFVVTDPSAELYTDLSQYCRDRGLDVKVLNLANPEYSDTWDILSEVIDQESERLDATRLNSFVDIYMQNSHQGDKDFWYQSAQNLIGAVIAYTEYRNEKEKIDRFLELYNSINGRPLKSRDLNDDFTAKLLNEGISFKQVKKTIVESGTSHNISEEKITGVINKIEKYCNYNYPFNIDSVLNNLLNFNDIEKELAKVPDWHPAKVSYLMFKTNDTGNVKQSALQEAQISFQLLRNNTLRKALSVKGINLRDINLRQSAYFVIMSDKIDNSTKPISSLFFSFLFMDATETFDSNAQLAKENNTENPCLPLVAMLDEFFSIGVIGGTPEAFGTIMSNSRKRKFYISIINQVYSQIEALYGKYIKDVIQGGCQTILFLGSNDPSSCKFISEFASGEATVLSESHNTPAGLFSNSRNEFRTSSGRRYLLTVDEARRWQNKVLVVKQGTHPLKLNPFPWTSHPSYLKCRRVSLFSSINKISELKREPCKQNLFELSEDIKSIGMYDTCLNKSLIDLTEKFESENKDEREK